MLKILWHPESPGIKVAVYPSLLRRLGLIREPFATPGEMRRTSRSRRGMTYFMATEREVGSWIGTNDENW